MFNPTRITPALMLLTAAYATLSAAHAQQVTQQTPQQTPQPTEAQKLERIEITGSSIRRIAAEGALPVQVLTAKDIARSGVTSVGELMARLPAMQGFETVDSAVGGGGGASTASIHGIGSSYTLVLLNGRRIAPQGSGNTVDLNAIPFGAIERVEILTDGASALYGADAIAGVINFVLKRNVKGGMIEGTLGYPLEGGGRNGNVSITYGIGDVDTDRFNLMLSYRHDDQRQLAATDRAFGSTSYLPVEFNGRNYISDGTSPTPVPANATVSFNKDAKLPVHRFNPFEKKNGKCGPRSVKSLNNSVDASAIVDICSYDFANTIEIYPEQKRDSLFLSGQFKVSDKLSFFADGALSRFDLTSRVAANPVPVTIPLTSPLVAQHILPYLSDAEKAGLSRVQANYRAMDFGLRTTNDVTDSSHIVVGAEAELGGWNLGGGLTWSRNASTSSYVGGYFKTKEFNDMVAKVQFDPFVEAGKQTAETQALMANSIFHGQISDATTTLTGADVRASGEVFKLPAGPMMMGVGGDIRNYLYTANPSKAAVAGEIYNYTAATPYELERGTRGVFVEFNAPIIKNLDVTAALRYDAIDAIKDKLNSKTVGEDVSATTYKISGRYQVLKEVLLRASYGTGFKSPSMLEIARPEVPFGVTGNSYTCPFPGTDYCRPGKSQYAQMNSGNSKLVPETSTQAAFGLRFEPNASFGIGLDYWQVKMEQQVTSVSDKQAFGEPEKYKDLFTTFKDPAEVQAYYAFRNAAINIGHANNSGVDWDIVGRFASDFGRLTLNLKGTYMIEADYTLPGQDKLFTDNMGRYGSNNAVTFRNIASASAMLESGAFTNTFILNAKSGYTDMVAVVRDLQTNKNTTIALDVPRYATLDWQGSWAFNKATMLRLGVKNIWNKEPPRSLRSGSGHMVGYDARYASPMMRTVYLSGSYQF